MARYALAVEAHYCPCECMGTVPENPERYVFEAGSEAAAGGYLAAILSGLDWTVEPEVVPDLGQPFTVRTRTGHHLTLRVEQRAP